MSNARYPSIASHSGEKQLWLNMSLAFLLMYNPLLFRLGLV
jgi:hypothetical protein